jgi:hypothetical protein
MSELYIFVPLIKLLYGKHFFMFVPIICHCIFIYKKQMMWNVDAAELHAYCNIKNNAEQQMFWS